MAGDVSVLQQELEALRAENARLKAERPENQYEILVQSINGIVWEMDAARLVFTLVSPQAERILGYPLANWFEPDFWQNHLHPADRDWAMAFCREAVQACRNHQFEYRMIAADGRTVWLQALVTIAVEDDLPVKLRGVMIDVTDRVKAEEALREMEARHSAMSKVSSDFGFSCWVEPDGSLMFDWIEKT